MKCLWKRLYRNSPSAWESRIQLGGENSLPPEFCAVLHHAIFWPSADHSLCSVCPSRPANSAVVSLAFGRYMLEPFFAPCAAPVPAVKLVSLLGYCKYSPLLDRRFRSLSAPDRGHLRGVIFWDNGGIGALPPWPPKIPWSKALVWGHYILQEGEWAFRPNGCHSSCWPAGALGRGDCAKYGSRDSSSIIEQMSLGLRV